MNNDLINSFFELSASIFILNHCRVTVKDKNVKGVSLLSILFFTLWGFWNLFYYPDLKQTLSFFAGIAVVISNICWILLILRYRNASSS